MYSTPSFPKYQFYPRMLFEYELHFCCSGSEKNIRSQLTHAYLGEIFRKHYFENNLTPLFRLYLYFFTKMLFQTNINNTMHSLVMVKWISKKHDTV